MVLTDRTWRPIVWLRRYLPAELVSLTATLIASWVMLAWTGSVLLAAFAATWAENLAYYGVIVGRELRASGLAPRAVMRTARALVLEFGPAELLDSLLIRPAALFFGMSLASSLAVGAIAGKLVADLLFYLSTISSFELLHRPGAKEVEP